MKDLKLIIVDDNNEFRTALRNIITLKYKWEIIAEACCGEDFNRLPCLNQCDIILMDIMLPDINGIAITKKALWENNTRKFIAITFHYDQVYLKTLLCAGFRGCIFKSQIFAELPKAIETVMSGDLYFPKNILIDNKNSLFE